MLIKNVTLTQCFPKSGPRTFFGPPEFLIWSARKKNCYSFCILSHLIIKFVNFSIQSFIFWSAEKISWIMWSAKFFFNVLWSASQESLGNTSLTTQSILIDLSVCSLIPYLRCRVSSKVYDVSLTAISHKVVIKSVSVITLLVFYPTNSLSREAKFLLLINK